ncbi:MAG: integrase [Lysobacterales bacterium RIFOXYA1_FULL_68_6]|nr:MAG: integrase [Xanthomonadales bacterium RIFOXYA1_FULL_68_6]
MPRGITQDQVNQAADAILGAGENPTVEKVRAELGTGSPNTVTRMLDTWRSQLGERLRQLSALPELPTPVGRAMIALWQLATDHASQAIAVRFNQERTTLEVTRGALATERQDWIARLDVAETDRARAEAARDLAEHACATLDAQLQDSHALRADLAQQRDRLQAQSDELVAELQVLRAQSAEQQQAATAERVSQETHVRNLEDRAHQEVDRARQEAKQWQHRHETAEQSHREALLVLEARCEASRKQSQQAEKEVARLLGQVAALETSLAKAIAVRKTKRTLRSPRASKGARTKKPK